MKANIFKYPNHKLNMNGGCCWLLGWGGFGALFWFDFFFFPLSIICLKLILNSEAKSQIPD